MRLFIALPILKSVKRKLANLQQSIDGVRWQQESQIHLTLKFLGETDQSETQNLKTHLKSIAVPGFSITLNGFGYFPHGKQPRVLWARVKNNNSLTKLHREIEKTCVELGFEAENRPFKPHITIARVNGASKREIMSFVNQHKQFQISDVSVEEFVLYESKLSPKGAKHVRLKTFSLGENSN